MRFQNLLNTAIAEAKAQLEAAEKSLIIYNYLISLEEIREYDCWILATDDQDRLKTLLTDSEKAELKKLIQK